jgi:FKBP-type peptidyl-prolyl cis-trans isomerase
MIARNVLVPAALSLTVVGCGGGDGADLTTFQDSSSYAIGMNMGGQLARTGVELDVAAFMQGFRDVVDERETAIGDSAVGMILQQLSRQLDEENQRREEATLQEGEQYRETNAKRSGVQTTASGLQYEVLEEGSGPKPEATARVQVHYRGTLIDGTEFDSSYDGDPVSFNLNGVIPGWTEGVQLMSVGSKYRLVLPPALAYGPRGAPPDIPPNATLIFEVELLSIEN